MKPRSKIVRVEAQTLRVHPFAQRDLVPSKLKKLMAELDLDAIGVLHAVEYEIKGQTAIWIIDGQHRWRALIDHGLGEWLVEVKIHLDATDDARASALFLKLNDRAIVSPFDKFANEVKAGVPAAVGVLKLVNARNLKATNSPGDGQVRCVTAMRKVYDLDGGKALALTLETVITAWGRTEAAVDGKIIEGVGLVHCTYTNGSIDLAALSKKLAKYPGGAAGLLGDAKGLRQFRQASLPRCVAETVIATYNVGRKTGRLDPL
jgi:hypothetical protein